MRKSIARTGAEAKKMLRMAIEQDVIDDTDNRLSEFIADRNRTRKNPVSISILEKTFFREFILTPPTDVEFEGPDDFRSDERRNLVRLMSLVAEKQLLRKWNPEANNDGHQRAERIFGAGAMRAWVPMLRDVVAQVLQLYDGGERKKVLFRSITDQQWGQIEGRLDKLFSHKIWDDINPDVVGNLKINAVDHVRSFLSQHGLTVTWVLGGQGE